MAFLVWLLPFITTIVAAQSTFNPARPPAIPLAVRSPYLSTWQAAGSNGGNGGYLAGEWPSFWAGATVGWTGLIRVDNTTYTWMGNPNPLPQKATQSSFTYTSTRSIFDFDVAGKVSLKVTFLSPVSPNDLKAQSAPISYVAVDVQSTDGNEHDVQIYTDVSAEWVSGDRSNIAQWSYGTGGDGESGVAYHHFARQSQAAFSEINDQAEWGEWYYAVSNTAGLTHQSGADNDVRNAFTNNGALDNSEDTNYRAINDRYVVFGFSIDHGRVGSTTATTLFSMFLSQRDAVQLDSGSGLQPVPAYWTQQYGNDVDALSALYNNFGQVSSRTNDLDDQVKADATAAGGQDYLTIVSLGVRQAWATLQAAGSSSTPYIFMKEISSNGNMNTVDVIYPFAPIMLYFNASWLKHLLDPIYLVQANGRWPHDYSIHDIGLHFPNATGHDDGVAEEMPVEESGNMLIMMLAYAQHTGDTDYLSSHYDELKQWTEYLVSNTLIPASQISTDDFAGPLANQTNLALKGIIAIAAMSHISNMTGHASDGASYASTAADYVSQWQVLGTAANANPPHTTLSYGQNDTHGLLYNLYADALLQTHLVPTSIYEMQSAFYPTVSNTYGVPLDTRHGYTKSDWELWTAAVADTETRGLFISDIAKWIGETPSAGPATDLYETDTGDYANGIQFRARPVVGGWFSLLALNGTIGVPS